jgi:hypothetical protein
MLRRSFTLAACLVFVSAPLRADEGLWTAGLQTQGYVDLEPGNDFMSGFTLGYSNYNVCLHQLEFQLAYMTSRGEAIFRPNILKEDWFLFSPLWHFRRNSFFDPTFQLDGGYQRYDTEFDAFKDLNNSTWLYGFKAGLALNFAGGRYALRYAFGYQKATSTSSLVYPLPFSLGFSMLFL